jgi:hypothetical protein
MANALGLNFPGMPRFTIKSLLIVTACAALWLSTLHGYPAARDVRANILVLLFSIAVLSAVLYRGKRQAFWLAFALCMLILGIGYPEDYVPKYFWVEARWGFRYTTFPTDQQQESYYFLRDMIELAVTLTTSAVAGFIGGYIYDRSKPAEDRQT